MWCIPPQQDAHFVSRMEFVLEVYKRLYDPKFPVVGMDEKFVQLISETRVPIPTAPGRPQRFDFEYRREGTAVIWMFTEPLAGWRQVNVTDRRTAVDWAHQIKALVDSPRYRDAERITLVCDNLNTHDPASLYAAFDPAEAMRIRNRIELVPTPKHGSWLNIAEVELSVMSRQCLTRRIGDRDVLEHETSIWADERTRDQKGVDWQFTTDDARIKLKRLYPKIEG